MLYNLTLQPTLLHNMPYTPCLYCSSILLCPMHYWSWYTMLWYSFLFLFTFVLRYDTIRYSIESFSAGMLSSSENLQMSLKAIQRGKRILTSVSSHSVKQCRAESEHTRNAYSWLCICSPHYSSLLVAQSGNFTSVRAGVNASNLPLAYRCADPTADAWTVLVCVGFWCLCRLFLRQLLFPPFLHDSTRAEPHFVHNFM